MWVSIPLTDQERQWLERLGAQLRFSRDRLWRASGVELALVTEEEWRRWHLPEPPAPILSLEVSGPDVADSLVGEGASWAVPWGSQPWGVVAGLLRFPSGLLVEVIAH